MWCSSTTSFQIMPTNTVHPQQRTNKRKVKKRKYAEIAATEEPSDTAPMIPGSVRKKRRLNSESSSKLSKKKKQRVMKAATHKLNKVMNIRNIGKGKGRDRECEGNGNGNQSKNAMSAHSSLMSPMTKQNVMRKVLNNEFNPKLSLSPSPGTPKPLLPPNDLQTPMKALTASTSTSLSTSLS